MASATGPADARFETTAAWAASETSTAELQNTVEKNAQQVHSAADDAAKAAQVCFLLPFYVYLKERRC